MSTTGNSPSSSQIVSFAVGNGLQPKNGPRVIPLTLSFSGATSIDVNLDVQQILGKEDFIQTMYLDNSLNPKDVICTQQMTGQRLIWPAGSQGYLPVLAPNSKFTFVCSGAVDVIAQLLSVCMPAQIWTSTLGGLGTDASGSAPGVAANILSTLAVNGKRALVEAQNQSDTLMQLVLDDGLATAGKLSIFLLAAATGANLPGGTWSDTTFKGRVRIACATAGKQCMLRET